LPVPIVRTPGFDAALVLRLLDLGVQGIHVPHVSTAAAARDLVAAGETVGRRLDFLTQEFMREANTLCAKAFDGEITRTGLVLKAVIEQMREQVQNIE